MSRMTPQQKTKLDRLISEGGTAKTIAAKVGVSPSTVQIRKNKLKGNGAHPAADIERSKTGSFKREENGASMGMGITLGPKTIEAIEKAAEVQRLRTENANLRQKLRIVSAAIEGWEE